MRKKEIDPRYQQFARELEKYADKLDIGEAAKTHREGRRRIIDLLVYLDRCRGQGNHYISIIKDMAILMALVPLAFQNLQTALGITLPMWVAYLSPIIYFGGIVVIGIVSHQWLRLVKRDSELGSKYSVAYFQTWDYLNTILEEIKTCHTYQKKK